MISHLTRILPCHGARKSPTFFLYHQPLLKVRPKPNVSARQTIDSKIESGKKERNQTVNATPITTAVAMVPRSDRNICSVSRPTRMQHRKLTVDHRRCWAHTHFGWRSVLVSYAHTHLYTRLFMHVITAVGQIDFVHTDLARPNFPNTIGITPLTAKASTHTHTNRHRAWNWWQTNETEKGRGKDRGHGFRCSFCPVC